MPAFTWDDSEAIAFALLDKFPDLDPLTIRFTDLHRWVTELAEFQGDPSTASEGKLEAIQMAWYEEWMEGR